MVHYTCVVIWKVHKNDTHEAGAMPALGPRCLCFVPSPGTAIASGQCRLHLALSQLRSHNISYSQHQCIAWQCCLLISPCPSKAWGCMLRHSRRQSCCCFQKDFNMKTNKLQYIQSPFRSVCRPYTFYARPIWLASHIDYWTCTGSL
jgi:hypothetical protein